jgi:hypothetical protein
MWRCPSFTTHAF